jgi:hypothetical protein
MEARNCYGLGDWRGGVAMADLKMTSGKFLLGVLERRAADDPSQQILHDLACDVYIKQWSYAVLNKLLWPVAVLLTIALAMWPLIAVRLQSQILDAAVVQTVVTALAAGAIYFYQFYKKRQMATENLLRQIAFSKLSADELTQRVIDEMSRIDHGFGFSVGRKADGDDENG